MLSQGTIIPKHYRKATNKLVSFVIKQPSFVVVGYLHTESLCLSFTHIIASLWNQRSATSTFQKSPETLLGKFQIPLN